MPDAAAAARAIADGAVTANRMTADRCWDPPAPLSTAKLPPAPPAAAACDPPGPQKPIDGR